MLWAAGIQPHWAFSDSSAQPLMNAYPRWSFCLASCLQSSLGMLVEQRHHSVIPSEACSRGPLLYLPSLADVREEKEDLELLRESDTASLQRGLLEGRAGKALPIAFILLILHR